MNDTSTEPSSAAIDSTTLTENIECPLCLYNLRGLVEPRCPECGYRFQWPDLLDPNRRRHAYLFEHHPRRNLWSFIRTLVGGLRPVRFWGKLHPAQSLSVKRLLVYWLLCSSFLLLVPVIELLKMSVLVAQVNAINRTYSGVIVSGGYPSQQIQLYAAPMPPSLAFFRQVWETASENHLIYRCALTVLPISLWPLLTFAALMIFQASMRKNRIRSGHVLRCVVYSADASVWYLLLVFASVLPFFVLAALGSHALENRTPEEVVGYLLLLLCVVWGMRLVIAYGTYLAFDHPILTVLASQIIVALAMGALLFWGGRLVGAIVL